MTRTLALFAGLMLASRLGAITLDEFAADKTLWTLSRDDSAKKAAPLNFVWVSTTKDTLRSAKGGKILGLNAGETLIRFDTKTGNPARLEFSLYNRGDQGEILEKDFNTLLARTTETIDKAAGVKGQAFKNDRQSAVRASGAIWAGADATYKIEWSKNQEDGRRPEFLKLIILPAGKAPELLKIAKDSSAAKETVGDYKGADHLQTNPEGDKWIKDVPMVDQGQKGYCAVASTERVMRLYGRPVDEHDLAQLADASGDGGTNPDKLIKSIQANSSKLHVRAETKVDTTPDFFASFVEDYNNAARKTKAAQLPNPKSNPNAFYSTFKFDNLDGPTLLAGRKKNSAGIKRFERIVADQIDKGLPVLWGVTLGYAPEVPELPQSKGGHMRLIIGYNARNHTIIYSDSWGKGHERKVMPADTAFAITNGMLVLIP